MRYWKWASTCLPPSSAATRRTSSYIRSRSEEDGRGKLEDEEKSGCTLKGKGVRRLDGGCEASNCQHRLNLIDQFIVPLAQQLFRLVAQGGIWNQGIS